MTATYTCAYCGEPVVAFVDIGGGPLQELIEDCAVCCRPNVLVIRVDPATGDVSIATRYEG